MGEAGPYERGEGGTLEITSREENARISKISGFYVVTSHEAAGPNRLLRASLS